MAKDDWEAYFRAVKKQNWQSARDVLLQIAKTEKNNPRIFLKIGDICQRTGEKAEAIVAYAHASQILRMQGFVQKALATYKIALRLDSGNQDIISRAEILMDELESVKATPSLPSPMRLADRGPLPSEDKEPTKHPVAPQATHAPEWLETTSLSPEQPTEKSFEELSSAQQLHQTPDIPAEKQELMVPLSDGRDSIIPEVFSPLPGDMVRSFMNELSRRTFTDAQCVIEEGESGDSLYIIRSGRAKVVAHLLGRRVELAVLGNGDVFGEMGFLTGRPRTASVIADGLLEVYEITRPEIEKLIESAPEIMAKIEDFYETRVQNTIRQIKS
jgi:hypothetical protein